MFGNGVRRVVVVVRRVVVVVVVVDVMDCGVVVIKNESK